MDVHLGIDIGATYVKFGVIDPDGHIEYSSRRLIKGDDGAARAVDTVAVCARELLTWAAEAGHKPVSLGVGSPGTINPITHRVQPPSPNIPEIVGEDFVDLLKQETGLPVMIDNDANCAAWAEYRYGAGRGIDNLICLTIGSGLGSGFIVNGQILRGPTGSAGELGHVSIDWDGPQCPCGNRGCLENYTSATAILKAADEAARFDPQGLLGQVRDADTGQITVRGVLQAAKDGDPPAQMILDDAAHKLAIGILTAVNIVDPEAVIIGGGVADADVAAGSLWLNAITAHLHRHAFSEAGQNLQVGRAVLGNDAGFIGAAALGAQMRSSNSD
ncbi:MAG: ROK family protein [candidate division Zixibacteria bacterium]|nr:ROK family protein [candidate division Zixibacteria bacterium]